MSGTVASAQRRANVVVGIGPFLTRDRGWNYDFNIAATVGGTYRLRSHLSARAAVTIRTGADGGMEASVFPPFAGPIRTGVTAGGYVELHPVGWGAYTLAGAEYFRPMGEEEANAGTASAVGGIGLAFGARRQWRMEGRYAAFQRRLSATRGHLDVAWLHVF